MKKTILPLIGFMAIATSGFAQSPYTIHNLNFPFQRGSISAVDTDNDGDRDLLLTGEGAGQSVQFYTNNGGFNFAPTTSSFQPSVFTTVAWGDLNGDGQPDAFQNGFGSSILSNLYVNNNGNFTEMTSPAETPLAPGAAMADFNNDGFPDLALFGNHNIGNGPARLYLNDGNDGWTMSMPFGDPLLIDAELSVVDYDNDGDLDLFLMAGFDGISGSRYVRLYRNDGDGIFEAMEPELIDKGYGSAAWGDYDGDGDLDLLLNGDGFLLSGEESDLIVRIYNNNGGTFNEAVVFEPYRQANAGQGAVFADWNNDGSLDVILAGWRPIVGQERQAVAIFLNNGAGNYTEDTNNNFIPGVSEHSIEVSDLDGDSDLDLIASGYSNHDYNGPGSTFNDNVSYVLENPTTATNMAPSTPTNLQTSASGSSVTFSWDASSDDTTPTASLSYNLYVKDMNGNFILSPLANTDNGFVKKQELGNVQLNTSWTIHGLDGSNYTWGVQAIDNSYMGSSFSGSILGTVDLFSNNTLSVFPNPSADVFQMEATEGQYEVRIYSVEGKLIQAFTLFGGRTTFELQPGIYILQAENEKGEIGTQKLVAQ